jgi:hypothetical protein
MNTYHAFYRGKKIEIEAETSYKAQRLASVILKAKKSWEVTVILVAKDGVEVVHTPDF